MKVLGRRIDLSDGRFVFFGTSEEQPDHFFLGFQNADEEQSKLRLSREAKDALVLLLKDPMAGMPLKEFPEKMVWEHVKYDDTKKPVATVD